MFISNYNDAHSAFEMRDVPTPQPQAGELLIRVEAFGLNFADVMARRGLYREAPPLPFVPGYDFVGTVEATGEGCDPNWKGKRVTGLSRFGSYAQYVNTREMAVVEVPAEMNSAAATALGVQYATAFHAACQITQLHKGERVLIHAAAGGVGTALVQLALWKGCEIFGTAGSDEKIEKLRKAGVHHPINYRTHDYETEIRSILGDKRLDLSFNAIAGSTFKKDLKLLGSGGRLILYGAAERANQKKGKLATLRLLWRMGLVMPILLMAKSRSILGVNMLKVADHRPERIREALEGLTQLWKEGVIAPEIDGVYPVSQLAEAHSRLENRESMGKIAVTWEEGS